MCSTEHAPQLSRPSIITAVARNPGSIESVKVQDRVLPSSLNPRKRSLIRGSLLVLASLAAAILLSGFPQIHPRPLLVLPTLAAAAGTADTVRCMQRRWSLYHGGVLLLIYMDLMALCMILFLLLYPYALWISSSQ